MSDSPLFIRRGDADKEEYIALSAITQAKWTEPGRTAEITYNNMEGLCTIFLHGQRAKDAMAGIADRSA